jgi:hypothetical protein
VRGLGKISVNTDAMLAAPQTHPEVLAEAIQAGVALITDWKKDFDLPDDVIKGAVMSSGLYDLKAVRLSARSKYVNISDDVEEAFSTSVISRQSERLWSSPTAPMKRRNLNARRATSPPR